MSRQYKYKVIRKKFWLLHPYKIEVMQDDGEGFENMFVWPDTSAFTINGAKRLAEQHIEYDKKLENPEPDNVVYESGIVT